MAVCLFILGIIAFLIMEHLAAFWLVFVPLAIIFVVIFVNLLRKRSGALGRIISLMVVFSLMIVALLVAVAS